MSKSATVNSRVNETRVDNIVNAVAALRAGALIVFPTETLYGVGADALNFAAVEKVFQLKGRDSSNPFPVIVSDRVMLDWLVAEISPLAEKLMAHFWPGPLTLVLPARADIPPQLVNATGGIGVRISSQLIATKIVRALGRTLTATSANPSGQAGARTIAQAKDYFSGRIDFFVDGGELSSITGSTVAEVTASNVKIIRAGEITKRELEKVVGKGSIVT